VNVSLPPIRAEYFTLVTTVDDPQGASAEPDIAFARA
jgi:hypothetical protein